MVALIIILIILFLLLGKSADFVIRGVKDVSTKLGISAALSGLILGFFTSTPEFCIGINSTLHDITEISFGNLMGGIMVLFGMVCGLNVILNKEVEVRHNADLKGFVLLLLFLFYPLIAASNGVISSVEGAGIIMSFLVISYVFFRQGFDIKKINFHFSSPRRKSYYYMIFGLSGIIIISKLIISISLDILNEINLPIFFIGLVIFSIGTNLPEIVLTVQSWRKKIKEFALGNIIGSVITNVFIIGILSLWKPIYLNLDFSFYFFLFFYLLIGLLFTILALTHQRFNFYEGVILFVVYLIFFVMQWIFGIYSTAMSTI